MSYRTEKIKITKTDGLNLKFFKVSTNLNINENSQYVLFILQISFYITM